MTDSAYSYEQGTMTMNGKTYEAIQVKPQGFDLSDATAKASDILQGKTAYGPYGKIIGTATGFAQTWVTFN